MRVSTAAWTTVFAIFAVATAVALWVFPGLMFPAPGPNDAPILWNLPMPVVALTLAGCAAVVVRDAARKRPITRSVALGTFLVGVAIAFVIGLIAGVADLQNDRFWPFLLSPVVFGIAGVVLLGLGVTGRRATRSESLSGAVIGSLAALFLVAWILARGSRDWLLAPYGFDVCLLITLEAAAVWVVGGLRREQTMIG